MPRESAAASWPCRGDGAYLPVGLQWPALGTTVEQAMDSREFGLVIAQQLADVEDLHYGYWDPDVPPTFDRLKEAQERYSRMLIEVLEGHAGTGLHVLDVGCGTGRLMAELLAAGHTVDGVIPAPYLERRVHERINALQPERCPRVFACLFEEMPEECLRPDYDVVLFSESFQYVALDESLRRVSRLLRPGGIALVSDFFKTEHHGDGGPGDKSFGGGHRLNDFHAALERHGYAILRDDDITRNTSPNLELIDRLLRTRIGPALGTVDQFLSSSRPWLYGSIKWLLRRRIRRLHFKYFSGHRSKGTFERYKSYRVFVLRPAEAVANQASAARA